MGRRGLQRIFLGAACAAAVGIAVAPSAASADVHWIVSGVFDDGATVSGFFNTNVYGNLDGYNLKTTGGALPGFDYRPADSYFANGVFYIDAQPGYQADLHLTFADDIGVAVANNPIVGGPGGPSWECQKSFSCYVPAGGPTRYIADGSASAAAVPEPATWAMMLAGFIGLGGLLRSRRALATAAT